MCSHRPDSYHNEVSSVQNGTFDQKRRGKNLFLLCRESLHRF